MVGYTLLMSHDSSSKVIVVNDDPVQLHMTSSLLEREGMHVVRCTAAEDALRILTGEQNFDAIVTDLHMPGIDGWRFCRLLRSPEYSAFNHIPILVISATFSGTDAEQITADLGANAFLQVPFDAPTLRSCMVKLLEGSAPQATPRVLIVADGTRPSLTLQASFQAHGCAVRLARTANAARKQIRAEAAEVVLLDYDLPGLTDHVLLRTIKAPGSLTAAVVLTSDPDPLKAAEAMRQGADAYVRKPFDPEYVITLCEKARRERALLRVEELLEERTVSLRDSEARFRSLVEGIVEIILVCDQHGVIKHVNGVGAQSLEWSSDQLIGKPLQTILWGHAGQTAEALLTGDEGICMETAYRGRNGRRIEVEVNQRLIVFEGKPAIMTVARDITERKRSLEERARLEEQLRQAQKMEAIGTLAGGIAHDFNNLLTVIMGHVHLIKLQSQPNEPAFEDAATIETVVYRAKALTDQLLGFARRGKHQNALVDVRSTVAEVITFLGRTLDKKIVLREEPGADAATVMGDPGQLHQVILNLSVNARDAMPGGGTITYRVDVITADEALRRKHSQLLGERYVVVSVIDTGCGIPNHIMHRIFEPFFTTKDSRTGTGMGLAMVYGIVHNHGGAIEVDSVVGQGTSFRLYLPFCAHVARPVETKPVEKLVEGSGKVLLVDDEELVRRVGVTLLKHLGYHVTAASNGAEAVAYYREHGQDLALVVLDMVMPGMNGRECFRALRDINPNVKAILVTGYDQNHAAQELLDEGVQGFIQKPYALAEFSKVVAEAIQAPVKPGLARSR